MRNQSDNRFELSKQLVQGSAIVLGLAMVAIAWVVSAQIPQVEPNMGSAQVAVIVYALLYASLSLLTYQVLSGLEVGLQSLAILAAYLTLGPQALISTVLLGVPLTMLGLAVLGRTFGHPPLTPQYALLDLIYRTVLSIVAALAAGIVYSVLGGEPLVTHLDTELLLPIGGFFLAFLILYKSPKIVYLYARGKLKDTHEISEALPEILLGEFIPLPLAVLLSISYHQLTLGAFLLDVGGAVVMAVLFRESQRSRLVLRRRVKELSTLNSVGQSLSSRLTLNELLQSIYDQINRLVEASIFVLVLKDGDSISFPFVMENGQRTQRAPRKGIYGVSSHVIATQKPLLLRGDVAGQLRAMGIVPIDLTRLCLLAVPLIADDEVIGLVTLESDTNPYAYGPAELELISTIASQAAVALRNASLYNRLSELVDELALVNNVSGIVTSTLDLDAVLDTTSKVLMTLGKADKAAIFLKERDGQVLRIAHTAGLSDDFVAQFQNLTPMTLLRQRETLAIPNVHTDPLGLGWRSLAELEDYNALLSIPLVANEELIGFLAAFYQESRVFVKSELDLLNTVANQVAVTLSNAHLFRDVESRAQEMTQMADAARAFAGSLDLDSVAQTVLDKLTSSLSPDTVGLLLLDPNIPPLNGMEHGLGSLIPLAWRGEMPPNVQLLVGSLVQMMRVPRPTTLPNSNADLDLLKQLGLQSMYAIPLVSHDKAYGLALIGHQELHWYNGRERQLVEALVNQAAIAVRNAQLYSQTDEALTARVRELSSIEAISRKISASFDLESIINDVLTAAEVGTKADFASCALGADPDHLTLVTRIRTARRTLPHLILPRDQGVMGIVMRTGKPIRVPDVRTVPEYLPPDNIYTYLSELCVPIEHNGEHVGVINLESVRLNAFTEEDERFIVNLADHAGIAIENARLFEGRQRQIDILIEFRKLSLELLSANSLRQVMDLIVEYALLIGGARDTSLYLYDPIKQTLTFGASLWADARENIELAPLVRDSLPWQVARSGKSQTIPALTADQKAATFHGLDDDSVKVGGLACIAIKRGNKAIGVLNIVFQNPHHFTEDELRVFDLLANQAAIAIEDVRLFDEVREGRDQMQVILDSTRDGMILIDGQGQVVLANNSAERLMGYPLRRVQGNNVLRQIVRTKKEQPDLYQNFALNLHESLASIRNVPNKATRRTFQINSHDIEETSLPVDQAGRPGGRLVVLRDITEEKSLENFRNEITDMMVHDLRSPLSNVVSCLRFMQEMHQAKMYEDFDLVITTALASSDDQMRMIESILEIARMETNRIPLTIGKWPLDTLVKRALSTVETTAKEAEIQLLNRLPAELPPLNVDENQTRRVVINLVDNAVRHTPSKGEVRVEAFIVPDERFVQVGVIDTGKGIPEDLRDKIFEKFVQIPKSALRGRRGIGLGLTFCKLAIEAQGGKIWVESGPEGGAAFWFTLPVAPLE